MATKKKKPSPNSEFRQTRARMELTVRIGELIYSFKSKEEPGYKLKKEDVINVLSSMISRRTE